MRLLIGGSPCTYWSIAQTKSREIKPDGIGWELFKNYLIARKKYNPDFFLYENNKSISLSIQKQITHELGVNPILINSALVSAQNRQRLYWTNIPGVKQPDDQGFVLRDVLEKDLSLQEKQAPIEYNPLRTCNVVVTNRNIRCTYKDRSGTAQGYTVYFDDVKGPSIIAGHAHKIKIIEPAIGKVSPVYEVRNGQIAIKGKQYAIKLVDGYYIIRKLSVQECMRLQTVPRDFVFPVSAMQAYKMLGNGWTVDVIAHILSFCPGITSEPLDVLSMYDGMSCGHLALNKLSANINRYFASEIDKYAIKTTQHNFPDTIQLGDAFQVREDGWELPQEKGDSILAAVHAQLQEKVQSRSFPLAGA